MSYVAQHDVIVVGAGPAGATVARSLACHGVKTLVLERAKLPRPKTCGGGITLRCAGLLDLDIGPVVERTIYSGRVSFGLRGGFTRGYAKPIAYMVMRQPFDRLLTEAAMAAGATILDEAQPEAISVSPSGVEVRARGRRYRAQALVGADGANSVVARALHLRQGSRPTVALEGEVAVADGVLHRWQTSVSIDIGTLRDGYAWVFPKADHLSIGVWAGNRYRKKLLGYYQSFVDFLELGDHTTRRLRGHQMPVRSPGEDIAAQRGLLVGDAAGVMDPLSGEGISFAIESGILAGQAILQYLEGEAGDLMGYQRQVDLEIMSQHRVASLIRRVYAWTPWPYYLLMGRSERVWERICRTLRGEQTYQDLLNRLNPLKPLFGDWPP